MATIVSVTPLAVERDSRTFKFASSFARLGHESVVVEGMPSRLAPSSLPFELRSVGGVAGSGGAAPAARRSGKALDAVRAAAEPPLALAGNLRWNLRTWRRLPDADLYHLHSYNQYPAVARRARALGVPYAYDAHDAYWEAGHEIDADHRSRLTRRGFERLELRCAGGAAALSTVSDGVARLLEPRFGRRPIVVRNFQDPRLDQPCPDNVRAAAGLGPDAFVLVMVGNAKPGDAVNEALTALESLPPDVHLVLAGRGHERFAQQARERGIGDRVHVLDPVPPTQVTAFIRSADASPILYRSWTANFEHALPNRFSHAVAAGLPLLYPPLTEISALCDRYGLGIPIDPTSPESIAAATLELHANRAKLAAISERVAAAAGELSWEAEEGSVRELLDVALGGRPGE
jgi:glycosyltransferase involved in cell wall biosynthesis